MSLPAALRFVYPLAYVLSDTLMLVFIKATSVNGHTSYNTFTANAVTELIKLSIATYSSYSDGSLSSLKDLDWRLLMAFLIPNMMYALNNNLFHYSVGALPPAMFVVAINTFRTLLTAMCQQYVSGKLLTSMQIVACVLLALSFVFTSLPDVIETVYLGGFQGSQFARLIYLAGGYSILSVIASISQEKLLKGSKSLMCANVINYTIGVLLQLSLLSYARMSTNPTPLFRGFDVLLVKFIPFLMAFSGLSISFILRYFDNIVKLMCSSFAVLLVHSITSHMANEDMFPASFLFGWVLTIPAAYLYNATPPQDANASPATKDKDMDKEKDSDRPHSWSLLAKARSVYSRLSLGWTVATGVFVAMILVWNTASGVSSILPGNGRDASVLDQKFKVAAAVGADGSTNCPLFEIPITDPRSSLRFVSRRHTTYGKQFTSVSLKTGELTATCPGGKLYVFDGPEVVNVAPEGVHARSQWRLVDSRSQNSTVVPTPSKGRLRQQEDGEEDSSHSKRKERSTSIKEMLLMTAAVGEKQHLDWSTVLLYPQQSHAWLWCDLYPDVNLVVTPQDPSRFPQRADLTVEQKQDVLDYIHALPIPNGATSSQPDPIFDTVLIVYLDSVSRVKFQNFYKRSSALLDKMAYRSPSVDADKLERPGQMSPHAVIPLAKLHSLGINSPPNYVPMMSGCDPIISKYDHAVGNRRSPWLSDIAEAMGFLTGDAYDACHFHCEGNCTRRGRAWQNIEIGGFSRQYMQESNDRLPSDSNWPHFVKCEADYNAALKAKSCSSCRSDGEEKMWLGHKPMMAHVLDWLRVWLSTSGVGGSATQGPSATMTPSPAAGPLSKLARRFGVVTIEDTHKSSHYDMFDEEVARLLRDLFIDRTGREQVYRTANTAMLLLADHGMHFQLEYAASSGKVANKQPFGYMILPRAYLDSHDKERDNLLHNSKLLTSHLDLRSTVEYWLTGRDSSAGLTRNPPPLSSPAVAASAHHPDRTYASRFGQSLATSVIAVNRSCADAGIPQSYCGCGKVPCDNTFKSIVKRHFPSVVHFINRKIQNESAGDVRSVCVPLRPSELFLAPGRTGCLVGEDGSININVMVKRSDSILDVTLMRKPTTGRDSRSLHVVDAYTISSYALMWNQCARMLSERGIPQSWISPNNWQHCHCVQQQMLRSWMYKFIEVFSA